MSTQQLSRRLLGHLIYMGFLHLVGEQLIDA
jgi:hypothetical protein